MPLLQGQQVDFGAGVSFRLEDVNKKNQIRRLVPKKSSIADLFKIDDSEDQLIPDKMVAIACIGFLFAALLNFTS